MVVTIPQPKKIHEYEPSKSITISPYKKYNEFQSQLLPGIFLLVPYQGIVLEMHLYKMLITGKIKEPAPQY